jgi:hypothetical protein
MSVESSEFKIAAKAVKVAVGEKTVRERLVKRLKAKLKEVQAVAVASVGGWRLILASLRDDDDASEQTLDEVEDCRACLRALVMWLAGVTSSVVPRPNFSPM